MNILYEDFIRFYVCSSHIGSSDRSCEEESYISAASDLPGI